MFLTVHHADALSIDARSEAAEATSRTAQVLKDLLSKNF
jgi:hypothetical protein